MNQKLKSFYDFSAMTIDGKEYDFRQLKGKKVLIVNTASRCGFTPQYAELESLYQEFQHTGFEIIGFPANNFLWQEPGSDEKIKEFCSLKYNVSFQMMSKISVKGKSMHPIYKWLTTKVENGVTDAPVKWNFQKFALDEDGHIAFVIPPKESPRCEKMLKWLAD